ncbi:unnamed protein product [Haemonchus placei]|uniref:G_PROTEIN_RECEP_F1_2 domain-containing protein n=1 Tax=Haemonchus placei TaxID=6290 RepID=A0A0N4WA46_HAEPC|nr:unnamed protein product [Haemonchus placei]
MHYGSLVDTVLIVVDNLFLLSLDDFHRNCYHRGAAILIVFECRQRGHALTLSSGAVVVIVVVIVIVVIVMFSLITLLLLAFTCDYVYGGCQQNSYVTVVVSI